MLVTELARQARLAIEPYLVLIRMALVVAFVAGVAFAGWRVSTWRTAYLEVDAVKESAKRTEKALATIRAEARQCTDSMTAAALAYAGAVQAAESKAAEDKAIAERIERDLQTRVAAADARGRDLARRLRDDPTGAGAQSVSAAASATSEPACAGGDAGRDAALGEVFAACSRDAERLNGWLEWWREVAAAGR